MKSIKFGNLVEEVQQGIIVHGCNAQGVMASGIAKEIRAKYPENYDAYHKHCNEKVNKADLLGTICWFSPKPGLYIANAITQLNYGRNPEIQYVDYMAVQKAFKAIARDIVNNVLTKFHGSIDLHYPTIGAGLGNGDWSIINDIIEVECYKASIETDSWEINRTLWLLPKTY